MAGSWGEQQQAICGVFWRRSSGWGAEQRVDDITFGQYGSVVRSIYAGDHASGSRHFDQLRSNVPSRLLQSATAPLLPTADPTRGTIHRPGAQHDHPRSVTALVANHRAVTPQINDVARRDVKAAFLGRQYTARIVDVVGSIPLSDSTPATARTINATTEQSAAAINALNCQQQRNQHDKHQQTFKNLKKSASTDSRRAIQQRWEERPLSRDRPVRLSADEPRRSRPEGAAVATPARARRSSG